MKKITAIVQPVISEAADCESDDLPIESASETESVASGGSSPVKIEVVVSDAQAQGVMDTLLTGTTRQEEPEAIISRLVCHELHLAEPDEDKLYERILSHVERELIRQVLRECDGVQTKAAARLGINRNTLHKRLRDYGLERPGNSTEEAETQL